MPSIRPTLRSAITSGYVRRPISSLPTNQCVCSLARDLIRYPTSGRHASFVPPRYPTSSLEPSTRAPAVPWHQAPISALTFHRQALATIHLLRLRPTSQHDGLPTQTTAHPE